MSGRRLPAEPARRGWCPGLARPMPTGDGLLARVHPPLGILRVGQLRAVAETARRFGNGHVDVTARANLQIRGVREETGAGLVAALSAIDLGDVRGDGGPQRLTLTSPLAGLYPGPIDVLAIARSIEATGLAIAGLPPKTLVLVEGDEADLRGIEADLHVRARGGGRAALGLGGVAETTWIAVLDEAAVAPSVAALLGAFAAPGRRRVRDLAPAERAGLARTLPASMGAVAGVYPMPESGDAPAENGASEIDAVLRAEAPFGRCTAAMLDRLADAARDLGTDAIRLAPSRGFVLPAFDAPPLRRIALLRELAAAGFMTERDDPRRAVAACPGAPACASGSTPTGRDATRLADAFRPFAALGLRAHVSGCAKGCAHPGRADLTLVGRAGRYGIVLGGSAGDAPASELTFEAALERVRRARPGHLAEAFADTEPSCRTTA